MTAGTEQFPERDDARFLVHQLNHRDADGTPRVEKLPVTIQLACMAIVIALVIGITAGVVSAVKKDTWWDYGANVFALWGLSTPNFWLGILLILVFAVQLGWLPASGYVSPFEDLKANLSAMIMPAFVLGNAIAAVLMRQTRNSMIEILGADYIRTAWAKGLRQRAVVIRHALKNAMLPVLTVIALEFAFLIGGLVVTETVFNLPGVARFLVEAILWRDYPIVQNLVMLIALVVVVTNFTVDMLYLYLNPQIRVR